MFKLTHRKYAVAVAKRNGEDPIDIEKFEFHINNSGMFCWVADPFPVEYKGQLYIFAELVKYKRAYGTIGYCKYVNGTFTKWKEIIVEPYHLSFPNIFEYNSEYYMCPESGECNELYFYKCVEFPEKWIKERVLIKDKELADTILIDDETGRYGLTCDWLEGVKNHHDILFKMTEDYHLVAFSEHKPNIEPFWVSRPAGKVFDSKKLGERIMVSQVCEHRYGEGLAFSSYKIEWPYYYGKLIKKVYPDEIIIDKNEKYIGMHTYNSTENYVVLDVVYNGFSPIELIIRARNKFFRLMHRH